MIDLKKKNPAPTNDQYWS